MQTYGSVGTHQEKAPGYPYISLFRRRATITVGATFPPAYLTRKQPSARVCHSHAVQGGSRKCQIVLAEDVQERTEETIHDEVRTVQEEVHEGSNVTCSQYVSVSNCFIHRTHSITKTLC